MQNCSKLFLLKSSNPNMSRTPIEFPCKYMNKKMGLKVHYIIMSDNLFYVHKYNQILLYLTQNAIH